MEYFFFFFFFLFLEKGKKNRKIGFERATRFFLARALLCRGRESKGMKRGGGRWRGEEGDEVLEEKLDGEKKIKGHEEAFIT